MSLTTTNRFSAFAADEPEPTPKQKTQAPAHVEKLPPRDRSLAKQPSTRPLNQSGVVQAAPEQQQQQRPRDSRGEGQRGGGAGVRKHAGSDRKSGSGRGDGRGYDEKKGGAGKNNWDSLAAITDPAAAATAAPPAAGAAPAEGEKPAEATAEPTEPAAPPEPVRLSLDDFLASKPAFKPKLAVPQRERQAGEGEDVAPGKVFVKKVSETSKSGDTFFTEENKLGQGASTPKDKEGQPKDKDLLFYVNAPAFQPTPDQPPRRERGGDRGERGERPEAGAPRPNNKDKPQGEGRRTGGQGASGSPQGARPQRNSNRKPAPADISVDFHSFPALGAPVKA